MVIKIKLVLEFSQNNFIIFAREFIYLFIYSKAIRDKNRIWGIIRTGVNQDGHASQPITAPSGKRQEELLHKLYEKYSMDPQTLQYIECHGKFIFKSLKDIRVIK